jgi:predicted methyltransferase
VILLSFTQAAEMLEQFQRGNQARTSLDLGKTETTVTLRDGQARLSDEAQVSLDDLRIIANCDDVVFTVREGAAEKLVRFSEATGLMYKLRPIRPCLSATIPRLSGSGPPRAKSDGDWPATDYWPALEISGILMHRIKGTTPKRDAEAKLRVVAPVRGAALETCMGLGYTAILAAATADSVTVIEKDENVLEMARLNPYSQPLFQAPKIKLIHGDATEVVPGFADASFDLVNHDPPTLSIAGELYADSFYAHLLRILKPGGKLLHYTGAPGSKGRRVDLNASVTRRLAKVGFVAVRTDSETQCVLALSPGRSPQRSGRYH